MNICDLLAMPFDFKYFIVIYMHSFFVEYWNLNYVYGLIKLLSCHIVCVYCHKLGLTQALTNDIFPLFISHNLNLFLSGTGTGNGTHSPFTFKNPIPLRAGKNEIALLCLTVGLQVSDLLHVDLECPLFFLCSKSSICYIPRYAWNSG